MSILRDLTPKIEKYLDAEEILLLIGARQSGKTTILHQIEETLKKKSRSCYFLNLEDPDYLDLLNKSPKNLFKIFPFDFKKRTFLLIDEVQYLANPSNFLKYFYDQYREKIKIVATGSSAFYLDKKFKDSLAGRKKIFYVLTLSFREFLRFKGEEEISKKELKNLTLSEKEIISRYWQEYLIFGGYPRVVLAPLPEKEEILSDLAYSYIKKDIYEANIRQDEIFYRLFKILASQTGNLVNSSELSLTLGVSKTSIDNYLYVMQKSFHIRLISPFFKNIRKEITKMPKVYFLDLGLRNFFLKNFRPFYEREDKGALLENAVFRQFLVKYDFEEIKFWRTVQRNEIDFVVAEKLAFEVKVQPKTFKIKNYKSFFENYPKINFSIISLDAKEKEINGYSVFEVWADSADN
jgi:predicted AAA+ superfamily ATPase